MIRTFIDAGVLIAAARGMSVGSEAASLILGDPNREFVSSIFLKMEVLPKAIYNQQRQEVRFYEAYFNTVTHWITDVEPMIEIAYLESSKSGLGTLDALHVAAALLAEASELITYEKPQKSIHRTQLIRVISIHPDNSNLL